MNNEFEIVKYPKLKHIKIFLNNITYRNPHFHNEIELFCIIDGSAQVRCGSRKYSVSNGDILLLNPNTAHEISSNKGVTTMIVQFSNHFLREYFPSIRTTIFEGISLSDFLTNPEMNNLWLNLYDAAIEYISADKFYEFRVVSNMAEIIAKLFEKVPHTVTSEKTYISKKVAAARLDRVITRINQEFEYPIRLADLAEKESITPTHLSHMFSESLGITIQEYINNVRFENAIRLMSDATKPLSTVAEESGFSDLKYLNKMFLKHFGRLPSEFVNANEFDSQSKSHSVALEYPYDTTDSLKILSTKKSSLLSNH